MPATRQRLRAEIAARSPARRRNGGRVSPHRLFLLVGVLVAALFTAGLRWGLHWAWLSAYLLAINLTTAILYGYDKRAAIVGGLRVPERILHTFAFAGGTPAAYVSQRVFRHKTIQSNFRVWFVVIFVVQLLAIGAWWYFHRQTSCWITAHRYSSPLVASRATERRDEEMVTRLLTKRKRGLLCTARRE